MKRFLAFLLALVISVSMLSTFGSIVFAADGLEAELWSPVEITLESTKEYSNPYSDVEIDAVFTHADGTKIKLPGFWKEGKTYAVRFSPTKVGAWQYEITCSDASNTSLTKTGTINAKASTKDNNTAKHGFIKTNGSFFAYDDGTPFFWLGDTHWQAPNYEQTVVCNYPGCKCYNQFKHEVDNRIEKGFTVYQTYFDTSLSDGGGQNGKIASIWTELGVMPSSDIFNEKVDYMFSYLHQVDMVVALGFGVHRATVSKMPMDQLKTFARYIVARYSCYSLVWITAQEITRMSDKAYDKTQSVMEAWLELASYVNEIDGYKHPSSAHMDVMDMSNLASIKLLTQDWHTWWATQGGHGIQILPAKNHYQAYCGSGKPVIEAEYNYEDINCGVFTGYDAARIGGWNAMLNGCAGYTYGAAGIWANCYSNEGNTGWYDGFSSYNYEPWYMGLDKPGSFDMAYMKNFFMTLNDWSKLKARYSDIKYADFLKDDKKLMASTEDNGTFVCYFMNEDTSTGTIKKLDSAKSYKALWYNNITGKFIEVASDIKGTEYAIPEKPTTQDWVFLLTSETLNAYSIEKAYQKPEKQANVGNIVTPYKVTAIGGLEYVNGRLSDNTKALYDLDGKTAWEPHANRVTQTIIYDLGVAYNLTQINIVPATETILPKYRIEGSNDGKNWTIIVNTAIHDMTLSNDKTYSQEALNGAYRYVKILLLNAENLSTSEVAKAKYRIVRNNRYFDITEETECYSLTAIAEISVFTSGKADITQINNGNGNNNTQQNTNVETKTTINIVPVIITGAVAVVLVTATALIAFKKKKED